MSLTRYQSKLMAGIVAAVVTVLPAAAQDAPKDKSATATALWGPAPGTNQPANLLVPAPASQHVDKLPDRAPSGQPPRDGSCAHGTCTWDAAGETSWWQRCKQRCRACFWGYPEEFESQPLGTSVCANARAMTANGEVARMVLYQCDFIEGNDRLNLKGADQLAKIATLMPTNFAPVLVERTPGIPGLDEARRTTVLNELSRYSFSVPPERVVVGVPPAFGLDGGEADLVHLNLFSQTKAMGASSPGGGGGGAGGSSGSSGFSSGSFSSH
jgi:hypothetical protein